MTINFSELSFEELQDAIEELQDAINLGKRERRKRHYDLIMEKVKKVYDNLQELNNFITKIGGDTNTGLDSNWQNITLEDCLTLFNKEYFDPTSFFPDGFFD